jgi:hypothetical protein
MADKTQKTDHGPLLKCKCPGCQQAQEFHIVEQVIPASFLMKMMLMFDRSEWQLVCQSCQHKHKIAANEALVVLEVLKQTAVDKSAEQLENFQEQMNQLSFVGELLNESMGWNCIKCDEKVAYNYQACWNCSAPHPGFEGGNEPPRFLPPMG